jgi:ABC-type lipoprotein export system ATPase subunit
MIVCQGLRYAYQPDRTLHFTDFACADAETLLILGGSGKGKTTLLHLMALLLQPQAGQIHIQQQDITGFTVAEAARFRAQHVGLVYQKPHFVQALSVMDNLLLANFLASRPADKPLALLLAETLGFSGHLSKKTTQLSQGEQQRVGIARALMNRPSVILADEPTASLDDDNCLVVADLLEKQAREVAASLVIVTHDQRLKTRFGNHVLLS